MPLELRNFISIASVLAFILIMLIRGNKRRTYILYVLYMFPFIDLTITPSNLGGFEVFHLLTYFSLVFLFVKIRFYRNKVNVYAFLLCILFFILLLGVLSSEFVADSLIGFIKLFPIFVYAKLLTDECSADPSFTTKIISTLRLICIISLAFLALQFYYGLEFSFYGDLASININNSLGGLTRYPGYFPDPQIHAQCLAMFSFLFLIKTGKDNKYAITNYLLYLLIIYALFSSGGRAGFLGLCTGLVFVFIFANLRVKLISMACLATGSAIILSFSNYFTVFNRQESVKESYEFRFARWQEALDIYNKHPTLGIGIDNYRNYVTQYMQNQYWETSEGIAFYDNPENGYLKILTEYGSIGFLIASLFILLPIISSIKFYCTKSPDFNVILISGAIISWMVSFMTVYTLTDLRVLVLLGTLICLLITAQKLPGETNNGNSFKRKDFAIS